jgi:hypothetical protein
MQDGGELVAPEVMLFSYVRSPRGSTPHADHLAGNAAFRRAYRGAVFMAHAETRRLALGGATGDE